MFDEDGEQGPRGTYEIYRAEGDLLYINGEYTKAIHSYSTALELRPGEPECLVSRSRCYLLIGNAKLALRDAEASLAEQPTFHKGLYQKAEALYFKGEFELALMFYHRGHRMRPEFEEFRLGIQKAREAIHNSVGSPDCVKLSKEGDLSYFEQLGIGDSKAPKKRILPGRGMAVARSIHQPVKPGSVSDDPSIKRLLGELYGDRVYLEQLLNDPVTTSGPTPINALVMDGLHYLDSRTEFWRQQQCALQPSKGKLQKTIKDVKFIRHELEYIQSLQNDGRFDESLSRAKKLMGTSNNWGHGVDREDTLGQLYSFMGSACLEKRNYQKAIEHFKEDLALAEASESCSSNQSRALGNLGRLYTSQSMFQDAVSNWRAALECAPSGIERAWMHHELGRCLLELDQCEEAKKQGMESLEQAKDVNNLTWQLNSIVLIGQVQMTLEQYDDALNSFTEAQDIAQLQSDVHAKRAIKKAINGLRMRQKQAEEQAAKEAAKIVAKVAAEREAAEREAELEAEQETADLAEQLAEQSDEQQAELESEQEEQEASEQDSEQDEKPSYNRQY